MRFSFLLSTFFFCLTLGSPSDILYIEKLSADEVLYLDKKDFASFSKVFTQNATYNTGSGPNIYGIPSIQKALADVVKDLPLQSALTTTSITLLPPFDEQGAASAADAEFYTTDTFFGTGDLAGQVLTLYAKYVDKYEKTGDIARYGGWRISQRLYVLFVSANNEFKIDLILPYICSPEYLYFSGPADWKSGHPPGVVSFSPS